MVDALVPNVSVWACTVVSAVFSAVIVLLMFPFDWKPVPLMAFSPSPAELNVTPWICNELVLFSLKFTVRLSPLSRLTPLYEASPASWSICVNRLLKLVCRVERVELFPLEVGVPLVVPAVRPSSCRISVEPVEPDEPMVRLLAAVEDATPRLIEPLEALEAERPDRLCNVVFNCASVWIWPVAVPKLMVWAAPPLTERVSESPAVKPPLPDRSWNRSVEAAVAGVLAGDRKALAVRSLT